MLVSDLGSSELDRIGRSNRRERHCDCFSLQYRGAPIEGLLA